MIDKTFSTVEHPENNFLKYADVESELLYGKESENPVFLTIVIITHKRHELLKRAIMSACNQEPVSYAWEIVLMDNNPDETEVLPYVESLQNNRIRYYRNKKNIGHEGNVNRGVELAKGKWVALLHDDDLLTPDYLVLIEQYINACSKWRHPLAYIRAKHLMFMEESELPHYSKRKKIENSFFIKPELWAVSLFRGVGPTFVNSCGSLVNRKAFLEIGGYNEKLNPIGDATLGFIFMNYGYSIYATKQVLGFYRQAGNLSNNKETVLGFIEADFYLREYLYSRNILTRLFGCLFREAQYSESVDVRIKRAEKYHCGNPEAVPTMKEINKIHPYKESRILRGSLRILRSSIVFIYKKCRMIWRER